MGSNLVVVAIPDENDRVMKVSSDKVPHLTLLFLGDADEVSNLEQIVQFVDHAASTTLSRFYLPVDRRGELGDSKADVLFFKKNRYDYKAIRDFRSLLLKDPNIKTAYDATSQFETPDHVGAPGQLWIPHLTLGYPESPAKPDKQDYPFYDVCFHKVAVWTADFDGPEFLLEDQWDKWDALETIPMDAYMSDIQHYGTKGMRWGVRNSDVTSGAKAVGRGVKGVGGGIGRAAVGAAKIIGDISFENKAEDGRAREMIINSAQEPFHKTDLPGIKARHGDYAKLRNRIRHPFSKEAKAYRKDARETYVKRLETEANKMKNSSGDRQFTIRERGIDQPAEGGALPKSKVYWDVSTRRVKHGVEDDFTSLEVVFDDEGYISELKKVEPEKTLAQTALSGEEFVNELMHYGIKGMHWGQRKSPPTAVATTATSVVPHGDKRKTKIQAEGGENHPASDDAIKVAQAKVKLAKSGTVALSNKELQDVANRVELEARVKRAVQPAGRRFVSNLLRNQGNQAANQFVQGQVKKKLKPA